MDDENKEPIDPIKQGMERVCEELGITMERLNELRNDHAQAIMDFIKVNIKPIKNPAELALVLHMVQKKCEYVETLNLIAAMQVKEDSDTDNETEES